MADLRGPLTATLCLMTALCAAIPLAPRITGAPITGRGGATKGMDPAAARTLLAYVETTRILQEGDEEGARGELTRLRTEPLRIDRHADLKSTDDDITAASALMRLSAVMARTAAAHADRKAQDEALGWVRRMRALADHVAESAAPTMEALLALRALDRRASTAEVDVFKRLGQPEAAARAAARQARFDAFYKSQVMARVAERARVQDEPQWLEQRRAATEGDPDDTWRERLSVLDAMLDAQATRDDALASVLLPRYRNERHRLSAAR